MTSASTAPASWRLAAQRGHGQHQRGSRRSCRRPPDEPGREATTCIALLIALAVVAFVVRLVPVLLGGGLGGSSGSMTPCTTVTPSPSSRAGSRTAISISSIRPGSCCLLSPFALIGGVIGDTTRSGSRGSRHAARGRQHDPRRPGRAARRPAGRRVRGRHVRGVVRPGPVGPDPYLVAPQATLLLLALLVLTRREARDLTARQVALAGVFIGVAGSSRSGRRFRPPSCSGGCCSRSARSLGGWSGWPPPTWRVAWQPPFSSCRRCW